MTNEVLVVNALPDCGTVDDTEEMRRVIWREPWQRLEDSTPRFAKPNHEAIPLQPAVVLVEKCGKCSKYKPPSVTCVTCGGKGHTGRIVAFREWVGPGFDEWSIAVTGPIHQSNLCDVPSNEELLRRGASCALQKLELDPNIPWIPGISWKGLLLHESVLYVVGVTLVNALPEGAEWWDVGSEILHNAANTFNPLSRAVWGQLDRVLWGPWLDTAMGRVRTRLDPNNQARAEVEIEMPTEHLITYKLVEVKE